MPGLRICHLIAGEIIENCVVILRGFDIPAYQILRNSASFKAGAYF